MLANRGRILAAAERGDRDAFLGLYDQFGPILYRLFFWLTGNESESRALVIATFRYAFRSFRKRPRNLVLDTWFYRMAVRTFISHTRWHMLSRRTPGPVEIEDRSTVWRAAVIPLPPRLRIVWLLTLAEGMPQSQTAEALGVSLDRVESLLERARIAFSAPDPEADRAVIERAMRQLSAPRPGATLRSEVAPALGTGDTTMRTRVMQAGIGLVVLALVASVAFSLLRDEEEAEAAPEEAGAQPKTIVVLGVADSGALAAFNAKDLRPSSIIGVGSDPRALELSSDGKTLYILQEDGLLTVDAESRQVGRLFQLPAQDWSSLAVVGQYIVVGSQTNPLLLVIDENGETAAEIALPWPAESLVPLNEGSLLAVAVDRTEMVRVELESQSAGETMIVGANLKLGAVVPTESGEVAFVTTPDTEEVWRVGLMAGQTILLATTPAARATSGALNADGTALYLGIDSGPVTVVPSEESSSASPDAESGASDADDSSGGDSGSEASELTMINTSDGSVERQLWQAGGITQMALDPAREILYALAPHANAILVLDSRTLHVRNVVTLAITPVAFTLVSEEGN